VQRLFSTSTPPPVVAQRCLHFAAWVSTEAEPRSAADDWQHAGSGATAVPLRPTSPNGFFCTELAGRTAADPFPPAVRFTLTLAAGRYAPSGYVIEDSNGAANNRIRIAGLSGVPVFSGAAARIGDEWIEYSGYANGALEIADPTKGRG